MKANRLGGLLLGLGLIPLAGCAERRGEVGGPVTLKNQPVASAVVNFFPEEGMPVAAAVRNGRYTLPNVPYGNYRVSVTPLAEPPAVAAGGPGQPRKPGEADPNAKAGGAAKGASPPIPDKYGSVDSSGLKCKVDRSVVTYAIAID